MIFCVWSHAAIISSLVSNSIEWQSCEIAISESHNSIWCINIWSLSNGVDCAVNWISWSVLRLDAMGRSNFSKISLWMVVIVSLQDWNWTDGIISSKRLIECLSHSLSSHNAIIMKFTIFPLKFRYWWSRRLNQGRYCFAP